MVYKFHVVLISAAILLALGMAVGKLFARLGGGSAGDLGFAVFYGAAAAGLAVYLAVFVRRRWGKRRPTGGGV